MHSTEAKRKELLKKIREKGLAKNKMAKEHVRLIGVLDSPSRKDDKEEAKKQAKELETEYVDLGE